MFNILSKTTAVLFIIHVMRVLPGDGQNLNQDYELKPRPIEAIKEPVIRTGQRPQVVDKRNQLGNSQAVSNQRTESVSRMESTNLNQRHSQWKNQQAENSRQNEEKPKPQIKPFRLVEQKPETQKQKVITEPVMVEPKTIVTVKPTILTPKSKVLVNDLKINGSTMTQQKRVYQPTNKIDQDNREDLREDCEDLREDVAKCQSDLISFLKKNQCSMLTKKNMEKDVLYRCSRNQYRLREKCPIKGTNARVFVRERECLKQMIWTFKKCFEDIDDLDEDEMQNGEQFIDMMDDCKEDYDDWKDDCEDDMLDYAKKECDLVLGIKQNSIDDDVY